MSTYRVNGMSCGGCVRSVTSALEGLAPDAEIKVSLEGKSVSIDGFDDAEAIKNAIEDAGFDFGGAI